MLQKNSYVNVYDNSGGKKAQCIHIYGGFQKRYAKIGDTILVTIKSVRKSKKPVNYKIKKGGVSKAIVLFTKSNNKINSYTKAFDHGVVLINNQNKYLGTRVFVPLFKKFRYTKNIKLLSMCPGFIV